MELGRFLGRSSQMKVATDGFRNLLESIVINNQLVLFFHKYSYLISEEEEDSFTSDVVTSILRAMRYGSKDARQLFPCLLQLRGLTHLSELFHKEASIM